ncbi:MAG: hypothetical protein MZU97_10480 [Bacillus subtilis]|nr:hypothetical protein [Bacillus subtilis]
MKMVEDDAYIADYEDYIAYIETLPNVVSVATTLDSNAVLFDSEQADRRARHRPHRFRRDLRTLRETRPRPPARGRRRGHRRRKPLRRTRLCARRSDRRLQSADRQAAPTNTRFVTIVGTFDFQVAQTNDTLLVTTIPTVRDILNVGDVVSTRHHAARRSLRRRSRRRPRSPTTSTTMPSR